MCSFDGPCSAMKVIELLELSLKSVKNSCLGRELGPTFDNG